jgi:hypothetical protein
MKQLLFSLSFFALIFSSQISFASIPADSTEQKVEDRVTFAGKGKGDITKDELMKDSLKIVDDYIDSRFKITFFRMIMEGTSGEYVALENRTDGKLTDEMKTQIKKATTGWVIRFKNISCKEKEGEGEIVIPTKLFFTLK